MKIADSFPDDFLSFHIPGKFSLFLRQRIPGKFSLFFRQRIPGKFSFFLRQRPTSFNGLGWLPNENEIYVK